MWDWGDRQGETSNSTLGDSLSASLTGQVAVRGKMGPIILSALYINCINYGQGNHNPDMGPAHKVICPLTFMLLTEAPMPNPVTKRNLFRHTWEEGAGVAVRNAHTPPKEGMLLFWGSQPQGAILTRS